MSNPTPDPTASRPFDATQDRSAPPTAEFSGDATSPSLGPGSAGGARFPFLSPPQAADEIGRLGGYRVLQQLGAGGMGFVFRGEEVALQRPVALKVMRPEVAAKPHAADRFLREGRAAAKLKSDHIITVYGVGRANGVPYLAMEFLEGLPLDAWLRAQQKAVPLAHALRVVRDTLRGLAAAHEKGLVHRDVKPANLWIEKGTSRVKVLDFGLTRGSAGDDQLTQEGTVVGTPAYMAPEQAGGKPVDARADLFSVGVVFYYLLAGKNPFARGGLMETLGAIGYETQPPVTTARPDVPRAYSDFVDRLLAKDPAGRPANARAALAELAAVEKGLTAANETAVGVPLVAVPVAADAAPPVWGDLTADEGVQVHTTRLEEPAGPRKPFGPKLLIGSGLFAALLLLGGIVVALNKGGPKPTAGAPDGATVDGPKDGKSVAKAEPKKGNALTPGPTDSDGWRVIRAGEVDLLALDGMAATFPPGLGVWINRDGRWTSHLREKGYSAVALPFRAEGSYTLSAEATLDAGNDFLGIALPIGPKGGVYFDFNGDMGTRWSFNQIKPFATNSPDNPTFRAKSPAVVGTRVKIELTVKRDGDQVGLTAAVDGLGEVRWTGPADDLSLWSGFNVPPGQVALLSYGCQWTVHALKYKRIDGAAYTRSATATALDPDRTAAEFILSRGGNIRTSKDDALIIQQVKDLPPGPFEVGAITAQSPSWGDADLDAFKSLRSVYWIMVLDSAVTDAGVAKLTGFPFAGTLGNLYLGGPDNEGLTDETFRLAAKFPALGRLQLISKKITGSGLAHLAGTGVAELHLDHCQRLADAELVHLKALPKLTELTLMDTPITDAGLAHVAAVKSIQGLSLGYSEQITDAGIKRLEGMENLRFLWFETKGVTSAALRSVAKINGLRHLRSGFGRPLADDELKPLTEAKTLEGFDLDLSAVTDAGLETLARIKTLKAVNLKGSKATAAGVKKLKAALPACTVESDFGP